MKNVTIIKKLFLRKLPEISLILCIAAGLMSVIGTLSNKEILKHSVHKLEVVNESLRCTNDSLIHENTTIYNIIDSTISYIDSLERASPYKK